MKSFQRFLAVLLVCFSPFAGATPSIVLEAYGDSLTAGFLTGTQLTAPPPFKGANRDDLSISRLLDHMYVFRMSGGKDFSLLAPEHWRDLAWPAQLATMLADYSPISEVRNLAKSGTVAKELDLQVKAAPYNDQVTHAFFYTGHNDLCDNPDNPEELAQHFFESYSHAIETWDTTHQNSIAYLMPVADISRVYNGLHGYVWYQSQKKKFTCDNSWHTYFRYCNSNYEKFRKGDLGLYIIPRVTAMNQALKVLAAQWELKSQGKNHFRYLDHLYDQSWRPNYFAIDCYHLSKVGQNAIAATVNALVRNIGDLD